MRYEMTFLIGRLEFVGPFRSGSEIGVRPGLFAILCETNDEFELLEVDHAENLSSCLDNDEYVSNLSFYQENCSGSLCAAVYYTDNLSRKERAQLKDELLACVRDEEMLVPAAV
jgi:hypothetical protein